MSEALPTVYIIPYNPAYVGLFKTVNVVSSLVGMIPQQIKIVNYAGAQAPNHEYPTVMQSGPVDTLIAGLPTIYPLYYPILQYTFAGASALPSWISFSRASNATQFDSTGALTYAPNNLLTNSNVTSAWINVGVTITSNAVTAPDGTATGTKLVFAANGDDVYQAPSTLPGTRYISSMWVRGDSAGTIHLGDTQGDGGQFPQTVTTGWTQVYAPAFTNTHTINGPYISFVTGDLATVYVWKVVFSAVTYETTPRSGDQVITTSAVYYGPRFDYNIGTLTPRGLLSEAAATDVVLYNRVLTNGAWTAGATMTVAHTATGIDGVANSASTLTGGAVSATNTVLQTISHSSAATFQTAYVKRITGTGVVNMTMDGGTTWTPITLTAGWTRFSIPGQTIAGLTVGFQIITSGDVIAVDLVQNENGTFATSGIITVGSSVARAADVIALAAPASTIAASGVVIAETESESTGVIARTYYAPGTFSFATGYWYRSMGIYNLPSLSASVKAQKLVVGAPY